MDRRNLRHGHRLFLLHTRRYIPAGPDRPLRRNSKTDRLPSNTGSTVAPQTLEDLQRLEFAVRQTREAAQTLEIEVGQTLDPAVESRRESHR